MLGANGKLCLKSTNDHLQTFKYNLFALELTEQKHYIQSHENKSNNIIIKRI